MSVESRLDEAFTLLLAKARQPTLDASRATSKSATINFQWGGGGIPIDVDVAPITLVSTPTKCDPILVEVPFSSSIVWAHLYAGDGAGNPVAVTATVDVRLTQLLTFGASIPLHGTGVTPSLTLESATDASIVGWQTNLVGGDTLIARLTTFSGLATWLAFVLLIRPTGEDQGVGAIVDGAADPLTDQFGNPIVLRN